MQSSYAPPPEPRKQVVQKWMIYAGIAVIVVLVTLLIWGIFWVSINHPETIEAMRDIMIIALSLGACLMGVAMIIITIMIIRLVNLIEFEIKPILQQTNETIGTVKGTTAFVSQNVIKPMTKVSGYTAGLRQGIRVLFGDAKNNLPD
jgi:hypothetical protein